MQPRFSALVSLFLFCFSAQAQWATGVRDYSFGTNQTIGQGAAYFPTNVLGPPAHATPNVPASIPQEVVSLGRNGTLTLTFDSPIADGEGADFVVFENAFVWGNGQIFDEWMIVSVSENGDTWQTFPYDTLTGAGMAGRTPTNAPDGCTTPATCGGDAFDLATVGLPLARYVRLQDATRYQGFDRLSAEVDAVGAIHQTLEIAPDINNKPIFVKEDNYLKINLLTPGEFYIFSPEGRQIGFWQNEQNITFLMNNNISWFIYRWVSPEGKVVNGIYFI